LHDVARFSLRRLFAAARVANPSGDVLAGEFVQCLWGGPIGFLRSTTNDYGLVFWLRQPGRYEIINLNLLRKAPEPRVGGREGS